LPESQQAFCRKTGSAEIPTREFLKKQRNFNVFISGTLTAITLIITANMVLVEEQT